MRIRTLIITTVAALALVTPARAGNGVPAPDLDALLEQMMTPQAWLGGRVTEADVELLFAYLKASLVAASRGREVPVPEELRQRAEAIGRDLQTHGMLTGLLLLEALEARAKQAIRESQPDISPVRRP